MTGNTKLLLHLEFCRISPLSGCLFSFSSRLGGVSWFWGVDGSTQLRSWVKFRHLLQNAPRVDECPCWVRGRQYRLNRDVRVHNVQKGGEFPLNVLFPFPLSLSVAPAVFYRAASFTRTPHREEGNAQGRAVSADQSGEISWKCVWGGVMRERQNTQRKWVTMNCLTRSEMEPHDLKHSAQALSQVFQLALLAIDYSRVWGLLVAKLMEKPS